MASSAQPDPTPPRKPAPASMLSWRDRLAANFGVSPARKEVFYCGLIEAVTLTDITYWMQVLFAAGIATLGLVLNSPAVIIGAMLISPLMGPILANGMAFAAGDLVLVVRAIASLTLSCIAAVLFAMLLIAMLPFKEQTAEIMARTQPNALDLVIALFSGALGSIATTKEPKGVVTSIPGVAIAVALMPPLCVVGYGLGIGLSINPAEGWVIARGGALLFLTNLTAITFTAMVVFLVLHIATPEVKEKVKDWHLRDSQSRWILSMLRQLPASKRLRIVGSLPSRLLAILVPILILLAPLQESLKRLQQDITQRQESNLVRKVATEIWQSSFANFNNDKDTPRAYISQISAPKFENDQWVMQMTVFTSKEYSLDERNSFTRLVSEKLNRPEDSVLLQLIEIPTTTNELLRRESEEAIPELSPPPIPSVSESQQQLLTNVETALTGFQVPEPATLLEYDIITNPRSPLRLDFFYLSKRAIGADALSLMTQDVLERLQFAQADVRFERIPEALGDITFERNQVELSDAASERLDQLGAFLADYPSLEVILTINTEAEEESAIAVRRYLTLRNRLANRWQIDPQRLNYFAGETLAAGESPTVALQLRASSNLTGDTQE